MAARAKKTSMTTSNPPPVIPNPNPNLEDAGTQKAPRRPTPPPQTPALTTSARRAAKKATSTVRKAAKKATSTVRKAAKKATSTPRKTPRKR